MISHAVYCTLTILILLFTGIEAVEASGVATHAYTSGTNNTVDSVTLEGEGIYLVDFVSTYPRDTTDVNFFINCMSQNIVGVSESDRTGGVVGYSRAFQLGVGQHDFSFQSLGGAVDYDFSVVRLDSTVVPEPSSVILTAMLSTCLIANRSPNLRIASIP